MHTRVILISGDRRFLKVAGFLLTRRGAEVTTARTVAAATSVLEEQQADLVLLDSGASLPETGAGISNLTERYPGLEVVVVADDADTMPQRFDFRLWPKWDRLDLLLTTVVDGDRVAS